MRSRIKQSKNLMHAQRAANLLDVSAGTHSSQARPRHRPCVPRKSLRNAEAHAMQQSNRATSARSPSMLMRGRSSVVTQNKIG